MQPSCPHCDQPEASFLRLLLMSAVLRTDETMLLLVDLVQQSGLEQHSNEPIAPPVRRQQGTVHRLRRSPTDRL